MSTCPRKTDRKAWEILGKEVPMYIMDIPQMKREKDIQKWAGTKRILLTGTPLAIPNWKLHHIIETIGAALAARNL